MDDLIKENDIEEAWKLVKEDGGQKLLTMVIQHSQKCKECMKKLEKAHKSYFDIQFEIAKHIRSFDK